MHRVRFGLALAFLLAACGGSTSDAGVGDGGSDGSGSCGGPPPPIPCEPCCPGSTPEVVCIGDHWTCGVCAVMCPFDGGPPDAAPPHDAGTRDAGPFACGTKTCDPATEYCSIVGGGVQPLDGGSNMSYACEALPSACRGDGTCACVKADGGPGCPCTDDGGDVTVECLYP